MRLVRQIRLMPWLCILGHLQREKTSVCGSFNPTDLGTSVKWEGEKKKIVSLRANILYMCLMDLVMSCSDLRTLFAIKDCADIPKTMSKYTPLFLYMVLSEFCDSNQKPSIASTYWAHVPIQRLFQMFYINFHQNFYINYHSINTVNERSIYYFTVHMPKFKIC